MVSGLVYCVLQASKAFYDNKEDLLQLWVHETFRVVGDRMWDPADVSWLRKQVDERLSSAFSTNFSTLFEDFNEQVRIVGLALQLYDKACNGMGRADTNKAAMLVSINPCFYSGLSPVHI